MRSQKWLLFGGLFSTSAAVVTFGQAKTTAPGGLYCDRETVKASAAPPTKTTSNTVTEQREALVNN
jgi:hypothetical protein